MSLARATDDPVHKQRYQDLALELVLKANNERGLDITGSPLAANKPKPGSVRGTEPRNTGRHAD
jgi:hypothetical protein